MKSTDINVIQVTNSEGEHAGLYVTQLNPETAEHLMDQTLISVREGDYDEPVEEADRRLNHLGIYRVYAIEVFSDIH